MLCKNETFYIAQLLASSNEHQHAASSKTTLKSIACTTTKEIKIGSDPLDCGHTLNTLRYNFLR
jgi:hypothetical protein